MTILKKRVLILCFFCLALPQPAHAMIELLPVFFTVAGIVLVVGIIPLALLLKRLLLRVRFGQGAVVPWKRLWMVTAAEAVIIACAFLLCLLRMESMLVPRSGPAGIAAIYGCATILYSLIALMPNLWLLSPIQTHSYSSTTAQPPLAFAWLLSLPVPLLLILEVLAVFAILR